MDALRRVRQAAVAERGERPRHGPREHPSTRILGNERMGSGLVVDATGLILTVNYVVMGARRRRRGPLKGRRMKAEVVAQDFEVGAGASCASSARGSPAATLAARPPERGDAVFGLASSGAQEVRVSGGIVTYLGEFEAHWEYLLDHGIVSSAANPGFGGGGLFTLAGARSASLYLNLNEIAPQLPGDPRRLLSRARRRAPALRPGGEPAEAGVAGRVRPRARRGRGHRRRRPGWPRRQGRSPGGRPDRVAQCPGSGHRAASSTSSLWRHEPGEPLTFEVMRDNALRRLEITGGDRAEFFKRGLAGAARGVRSRIAPVSPARGGHGMDLGFEGKGGAGDGGEQGDGQGVCDGAGRGGRAGGDVRAERGAI